MHRSDAFIPKYSELSYNGFWFSPEREALQALVTETQRDVTGVARLKLYDATSSSPDAKAGRASTIQRLLRWEGRVCIQPKRCHGIHSTECAAPQLRSFISLCHCGVESKGTEFQRVKYWE